MQSKPFLWNRGTLQGLEDYLLSLYQEELFSRYLFQLQNSDSYPGESVRMILANDSDSNLSRFSLQNRQCLEWAEEQHRLLSRGPVKEAASVQNTNHKCL